MVAELVLPCATEYPETRRDARRRLAGRKTIVLRHFIGHLRRTCYFSHEQLGCQCLPATEGTAGSFPASGNKLSSNNLARSRLPGAATKLQSNQRLAERKTIRKDGGNSRMDSWAQCRPARVFVFFTMLSRVRRLCLGGSLYREVQQPLAETNPHFTNT